MTREDVEFLSDGLKLRGHLYVPEGIDPPYPTVVMAGGWCYVKELIQPEYAQALIVWPHNRHGDGCAMPPAGKKDIEIGPEYLMAVYGPFEPGPISGII